MPSASASYAPSNRSRPKSGRRPAPARVRWDKLGRVAMLLVLMALVFLYLSAGAHLLSSWKQSRHDNAAVAAMEREHRALLHQHNLLSSQSNLEVQARQLDMVRPGERSYVVTHLPDN
jgi:hypothetical protein